MPRLSALVALVVIVVLIVAGFAVYASVTYPRTVVSIPVAFTIGADSSTRTFDQGFLDDKVQVQVQVNSGAALWRAQIISQGSVIWEHAASQGEQQSYTSNWIQLSPVTYNFTFGTIGIGSLQATATVSSKGGFW